VEPRRRRSLHEPSYGYRDGPAALERPHAGDHLVHDDTQGVDVGRGRQFEPLYLFRGHVDGCPANHSRIGEGSHAVH
jgi:hypothetical protein